MKFVWCGGGPAWSWWQLFIYNTLQRRAERVKARQRARGGVEYPAAGDGLGWWP